MLRKFARQRIELSRQLVLPLLFLSLLSVPWFLGGRDPFGLVVIAAVSLLLFASWLVLSRDRALRLSLRPKLALVPASILVFWSLLSWFWSVSRYESTLWLITLTAAAVVFVVSRDVFRVARARVFYAKLFVLSSVVVSLIGLAMYVFGDYDRATSVFFWPNPFATYLLMVFPVALALGMRSEQDRPNGWHWASVLTLGMLMLTFSRAAWIVGLLLIGLIIWLAQERRRCAIIIATITLGAFGMAVAASSTRSLLERPTVNVTNRLAESAGSSSVTDRVTFWREGTQMFADRPLVGWGAGAYREVHPAYQESPITATNNPHSSLVQAMVELGVVGFVAAIIMFAGMMIVLWKDRKADRGYVTRAAQLALIGFGLHSLVDLVSNYPTLLILGAIFMALALPLSERAHEFRLRNRVVMALSLVVVGLLGYGVWFSYQSYLAKVDQQYIDAVTPFDTEQTLVLYEALTERSFVEPDTLSRSALFLVDIYDSQQTSPNRNLLDRAARLATEATRREPQDARHWYALANASERQGKTSEALQAYRKAVELDRYNNPQYQISYARLLNQEGFTREAREVIRQVTREYTAAVIANRNFIRIGDRLAIAWTLQAELENILGDQSAAREAVRRAIELNPSYQPAIDLEKLLTTQ